MLPSASTVSRRRDSRRGGGSRCSHSARLDVPLLELGSNMSLQLAHERNGTLLKHASSSTHDERCRILHALSCNSTDLSKAQMCGHCHQLTARLTESLLHHLLFAKGQLPEPVSLLRKKKELSSSSTATSARRRSHGDSSRARKEEKLLRRLAQLRQNLEEAAKQLDLLNHNRGEGPSSQPDIATAQRRATQDMRLLVVVGTSVSMPREVFVLDLIQAIGAGKTTERDLLNLVLPTQADRFGAERNNEDMEQHLAELFSDASDRQREAARDKTSSNWERKLVRLLVSDERLESFLGSTLAPTKMHLFLSAPASFRCSGWSARHHLDFNLDHLCEAVAEDGLDAAPGSTDTSVSIATPDSASADRKRAPASPLQGPHRMWTKSPRGSSSSVADSWPEDSASEHHWESSISSISEDSRPPSAADKHWQMDPSAPTMDDGWSPACSSPHLARADSPGQGLHSIEASRTGSSFGSSTVYGHDTNDVAMDLSLTAGSHSEGRASVHMDGGSPTDDGTNKLSVVSAEGHANGIRRRSREPKAGGLLSRNLLKARQSRQSSYAASDSSSVRSAATSLRRAPRCSGLQIDFTDPERAADGGSILEREDATTQGHRLDYCWFQCEVVLEGFR